MLNDLAIVSHLDLGLINKLLMSIQASRDARCAGTLFLSDTRYAHTTPGKRQFLCLLIQRFPAYYLIRRRQRELHC